MVKRRRVTFTGPIRPIDKALINVSDSIDSSQFERTVKTAVAACTVTGIRWTFGTKSNSNNQEVAIALVLVRDGQSVSTLSFTAGSNLYEPEQDVLMYYHGGCAALYNNGLVGSTKTMRKLKNGDQLKLIGLGDNATADTLVGTIQLFCKE